MTRWTPVRIAADDDAATQVLLGPGYGVALTGRVALDGGVRWVSVAWRTPARHGTGWLPAAVVTRTRPTGTAFASLDALDRSLASYLAAFGTRVGVDVVDVTRHVAYTWNASLRFITASSMKVPIMLTLLAQAEAAHRSLTSAERSLLAAMIEWSDNTAAGTLYAQIGGPTGITRWLAQEGISGLYPATPEVGWGWSTVQPWTMAVILQRLRSGRILTAADRSYALGLMRNVVPSQRFGVGTGSPARATVAMKNGWVIGPDGLWAVNSSGIVTLGRETYVITVYTRGNGDLSAGITLVTRVARAIGAALT